MLQLRRHIAWLLPVGLLAGVLGVYGVMLTAEFVYDSRPQILVDDYLHQPRHLLDVLTFRVVAQDVLDGSRPVHVLSLMLDALLWGKKPVGYHLTNILLHAAVAIILLWLVRDRCGGKWLPAAVAAALFAFHPVNSEAVCEVSYREDLLAALFILLGLRFAEPFPALCVVSMFCAAASKENALVGPALLALFLWPFNRRRFWLVVAAATCVGAFLVARFALEPADSVRASPVPQYIGGTFAGTLLVQPRIWAAYIQHIVWPTGLCADYGPYTIRHLSLPVSLLAIAGVLALQAWLARKNRAAALGAAWFWLALLPVSNFLPLFQPMADRFLYLPMLGLAVMLAGGKWTRPAMILGLVVAAALIPVTIARQRAWHNRISLWSDTLRVNPLSQTAANNLGFARYDAGDLPGAIEAWRRALELTRDQEPDSWAGIAIASEALAKNDEADAAFRRAVALDVRYADPDALLRALIWERHQADALRPIAARNAHRLTRLPS